MTTDLADPVKSRTIPQKGSDRPASRYLQRYVVISVASKWHDIGLELMDISDEHELDALEVEPSLKDDTERAKKMFKRWLEKKPYASWNDLIEVLKLSHIGLCTLAYDIEGKLLSETNSQGHLTYIDFASDTSTLTASKSEVIILKQNSDQQQHSPEDDAKEEHITGFPTQQKTVMETFPPPSIKSVDATSTTSHTKSCSTDSATSNLQANDDTTDRKMENGKSRSVDTTSTTSHTKSCSIDSATSNLQANDDTTDRKMDDSKSRSKIRVLPSQLDSLREAQLEVLHLCEALEKLKETLSEEMNKNVPKTTVECICDAVSEHYNGPFVGQWRDQGLISGLAALVLERDGEMKVVVLTTGTAKKKVCSYFSSNGSADECMWDHCDGHAVAVCYRFAVYYLITEMHRHSKNCDVSILKMERGGYALKEGIELHFFSTKIPCGFMGEEDCPLLSWKVPFKGKPHCLKCSSIILISTYLGIQGLLSHLFNDPVYISSITIPKCENGITESKIAEIKWRFKSLKELLVKNTDIPKNSDYKLKIPSVEIADVDARKAFKECFDPCEDELCLGMQIKSEKDITQTKATYIDSNIGIIYTSKNKLGTDTFRKKMTSQLESTTNVANNKIRVLQSQLDSLREAQLELSKALNPSEALKKLKEFLTEEMNKKFPSNYQSDSGMGQCRPTIDEVAKWKNSFCDIIERYEKDLNTQAVKESLPLLKQNFETHSSLVMESLKKFETDAKSIENILTAHKCDYEETLDALKKLLDKSNGSSCDHQFYLDLMGCDWARYWRAMNNDVKTGNCGSAHQAPSLPSSASLPEGRGQLKYNTNDDDINIDTKPAEMSEENESNLNIFGDVQENAQTGTAESQQKKLQNNDHHDYHDQLSSSLSSPHNESQQQHSDHDKNSNAAEPDVNSKPMIDIEREPQNIAVAQEESQSEMVEPKEEVSSCSSPVGSASGSIEATMESDLQTSNASLLVSLEHSMFSVEPRMHDLIKIVIPKVSAEWKYIAYALGYEVSAVNRIRSKHNQDPTKCCEEVFEDWLGTSEKPKIWRILLRSLIEVEQLGSATKEIIEKLIQRDPQQ